MIRIDGKENPVTTVVSKKTVTRPQLEIPQHGSALTGSNYPKKSNRPTPERAPKKTLDTRQKRKSAQQILSMHEQNIFPRLIKI